MKIETMNFTAKNGQTVILRSGEEQDGEQLRRMAWQAYGESRFLSKEQEEFTQTAEQESAWIMRMLHDPRAVLLFAELDGTIVGNAMLHPVAESSRQRQRCQVGLTVLQAHWSKGIGKALLALLISMARESAYEQVELEVVADNVRAISLYEKLGFKEVCRKKDHREVNGKKYDAITWRLDLE